MSLQDHSQSGTLTADMASTSPARAQSAMAPTRPRRDWSTRGRKGTEGAPRYLMLPCLVSFYLHFFHVVVYHSVLAQNGSDPLYKLCLYISFYFSVDHVSLPPICTISRFLLIFIAHYCFSICIYFSFICCYFYLLLCWSRLFNHTLLCGSKTKMSQHLHRTNVE